MHRAGIGRNGDLRLIQIGEEARRQRVYGRGVTRRKVIDIGLPFVLRPWRWHEAATSGDMDAPLRSWSLFALGTTLPLLLAAAAHPLVVRLAILACVAVLDAAYGIGNNASAPFAGLLVAVYASGAYTRSPRRPDRRRRSSARR